MDTAPAAPDLDTYVDNGDGYYWLACGICGDTLMEIEGGTNLHTMNTQAANHRAANHRTETS